MVCTNQRDKKDAAAVDKGSARMRAPSEPNTAVSLRRYKGEVNGIP